MTAQELGQKYNVSVSSIKTNFNRTSESILRKYGMRIIKHGRGGSAYYTDVVENDMRAITMYEEKSEDLGITEAQIKLMNWDLLTLLGIIVTPMLVFRGSYSDFLSYIGVAASYEHIKQLKKSLLELQSREFIIYHIDETDNNYFIASLYRKVEQDMKVGITMIRHCKKLAEINNKRSWIPLLKVWVGIQKAEKNQPFTNEDLKKITGLSEYTIRANKKLLQKDEIFKTKKLYAEEICMGQEADLNKFYNK